MINESEINKLVSEVDDRIEEAFNGVSEGSLTLILRELVKLTRVVSSVNTMIFVIEKK